MIGKHGLPRAIKKDQAYCQGTVYILLIILLYRRQKAQSDRGRTLSTDSPLRGCGFFALCSGQLSKVGGTGGHPPEGGTEEASEQGACEGWERPWGGQRGVEDGKGLMMVSFHCQTCSISFSNGFHAEQQAHWRHFLASQDYVSLAPNIIVKQQPFSVLHQSSVCAGWHTKTHDTQHKLFSGNFKCV